MRKDWPDDTESSEAEWDIRGSVFWGYIPDDDDIVARCFEYDWARTKIPRIIKKEDELEKIRVFLKSIYKPIREVYKYYAGVSPCGNIPCIGQNAFNEIINQTNIVDGVNIKLSDIDFEFIATKSGTKGVLLNPERWLVRYQLMEIFVRISLQKYFKKQKEIKGVPKLTESDSVIKLFQEELIDNFVKYD